VSTPGAARLAAGTRPWQTEAAVGIAGLDALASEWRELWAGAGGGEPFVHPQWIRAQVAALEDPRRLLLVTARRDGRLGAALALIRERGGLYGLPVRRWRAAAGVYSVRFDLCALPGDEGRQAASAIGHYLGQRRDWDVIELRDVPAGGAAEALVAAAQEEGSSAGVWASLRSPYLGLEAGAAWEQALKASFRQRLRRTRRRLEETGSAGGTGVQLRQASWSSAAGLQAELEEFYRLESSGWKGRQRSAIAARPRTRAFYDQACTAMAAEGCLVLHRLEFDGDLMAMACGLRHSGWYYVLKWSYNEAYAKFGAGQMLTESILRECAETGLQGFDFTGPDDEYKRRWTDQGRPHAWLYMFRRGVYGDLLRWAKFGCAPRLRSWLRPAAKPPDGESS